MDNNPDVKDLYQGYMDLLESMEPKERDFFEDIFFIEVTEWISAGCPPESWAGGSNSGGLHVRDSLRCLADYLYKSAPISGIKRNAAAFLLEQALAANQNIDLIPAAWKIIMEP